ncbi:MAG: tripartite tricarboxylate transporter substrate binding protein [Curvibacter sp.]|nr:tripartite tricarboxylate transporter substrate binding protein [Curvibacter sp.]
MKTPSIPRAVPGKVPWRGGEASSGLRRRRFVASLALAPLLGNHANAGPVRFPELKPLTLVVPYPAGGASDAAARILNGPIGEALGQQVLVENVAGGTGVLAARRILNSPADGYAFLHGSVNEIILPPLLNRDLKFQPEDFRLVQPLSSTTIVLVSRPDLPVSSFDQFIGLAKARGRQGLTFGSVGVGSLYHLITEDLAHRIGAQFLHVPYKGGAPVLQDLGGGQIDFAILAYQLNMEGMAQIGRLKLITSLSRQLPLPLRHLPTIDQSRNLPDFEYEIGGGYYVRHDTPGEALDLLREAVGKAISIPAVRSRLEAEGRNVMQPMSQVEADQYHRAMVRRQKELIRRIGVPA